MLIRRGTSVVELLVALTLTAIILGSATGSMLRQRRTVTGMISTAQASAQVRAATALLPAQLALLSPSSDDLVPGEVRDTALQFGATVATGVTCDSSTTVTFAVDDDATLSSGVASPPRAGDSLWWYGADSSRWTGRRVSDAWSDSLRCAGAESSGGAPTPRRVYRVASDGGAPVPALAPLRITRPFRLTIYRSGDGTWQFGLREWSEATKALATVQPVAGPFQRVSSDGARTGFRYFDAAGTQLFPELDPAARVRVSRIRVTALALPSGVATLVGVAPPRDSTDVALAARPTP